VTWGAIGGPPKSDTKTWPSKEKATAFVKKMAAAKMKKKQIWFLNQDDGADFCTISSHLGKKLYINNDGNACCDGNEQGGQEELQIIAQDNGAWAIRSKLYGFYLGNKVEMERTSFLKDFDPSCHLWTVHLAMHPQINLKNVKRKSYMHLKGDEFHLDEIIPWGEDATITLQFFRSSGTYGLESSDGRLLTANGKLVDGSTDENKVPDDAKFIIVFQGGKVSFKSKATLKFLTGLGASGTCKCTKSSISQDEQFEMEDSFPQIKLTAYNKKKVSVKGGIEVSANAEQTTDREIFQVEPVNGGWTFKSSLDDKGNWGYWALKDDGVQAISHDVGPETTFQIKWLKNKIAIVAPNGKYVQTKPNNMLKAVGDGEDENTTYVYEIVNRPRLVLRGEYGFVGTLPSGLLECNKSVPEVYAMHVTQGFCKIKHQDSGKYWKLSDNGVSADGDNEELYTMELHPNSMLCLISPDNKYLEGFQNGEFKFSGGGPGKSTFFEY